MAHFKPGDLVWAKIPHFPTWPCQIVHPDHVDAPLQLEPGKVGVFSFGDNKLSVVDVASLEPLSLPPDQTKKNAANKTKYKLVRSWQSGSD